jgi:hypothetical protein
VDIASTYFAYTAINSVAEGTAEGGGRLWVVMATKCALEAVVEISFDAAEHSHFVVNAK